MIFIIKFCFRYQKFVFIFNTAFFGFAIFCIFTMFTIDLLECDPKIFFRLCRSAVWQVIEFRNAIFCFRIPFFISLLFKYGLRQKFETWWTFSLRVGASFGYANISARLQRFQASVLLINNSW